MIGRRNMNLKLNYWEKLSNSIEIKQRMSYSVYPIYPYIVKRSPL